MKTKPSLPSTYKIAFVIGFAFSIAAGVVPVARATSRAVSASVCARGGGDVCCFGDNYGGITTYGAASSRTDFNAYFECPPPDDDQLPAWTVTHIKANIRDSHSDAETLITACVRFFNMDGQGACGAITHSGIAAWGEMVVTVDPSAWQNHPWDYAYMTLSVVRGNGNGTGTVRGFKLDNG
jgi:hypothetical protein